MPKKLTQQEAEKRIKIKEQLKGFKCKPFIYKNNKTRLYLICNCGYEWNTSFAEISDGTGCPECYGTRLWTQEEAEEKVASKCRVKNYTFKSFVYVGVNTELNLKCHCGYEWPVTFIEFTRVEKRGCPKCAGKAVYTQKEAEQKVTESLINQNMKHKSFVYVDNTSRILLECLKCGHEWDLSFNMITSKRKRGCPSCKGKTQTFSYIHSIHKNESCIGIKYGIESYNDGRRLIEQNSRTEYDIKHVCSYKFSTVSDCQKAELECKKLFQKENKELFGRKGYITKEEMRDGWTETTSVSNIEKIISIYEKWGGIKQ